MKRILVLFALVALLVPLVAANLASRVEAQDAAPSRAGQQSLPVLGFDPAARSPFDGLENARHPVWQNQVRIEQRVVIRISPAAPGARNQLMADLPRRRMTTRYAEVEHGDCVDVENVLGIQSSSDNRLLFYTSDRDILAATLEEGCSARAFYSGFYIEKNDDGRLCVERDRLQSRAGASCEIADFSRLVAVAQ